MNGYTLAIPERLYSKVRQVAEQLAQPMEDLLLERIDEAFSPPFTLPLAERSELFVLAYLSDDALWALTQEQIPNARQARQQVLMDKIARGTIISSEYDELIQRLAQGHNLIKRKAEAVRQLLYRGYTVTLDDLTRASS